MNTLTPSTLAIAVAATMLSTSSALTATVHGTYISHWAEGDVETAGTVTLPHFTTDAEVTEEGADYEHHSYDEVRVEANNCALSLRVDEGGLMDDSAALLSRVVTKDALILSVQDNLPLCYYDDLTDDVKELFSEYCKQTDRPHDDLQFVCYQNVWFELSQLTDVDSSFPDRMRGDYAYFALDNGLTLVAKLYRSESATVGMMLRS